ncbi:MAG: STAS domain-containing protein [Desulfobacterales bacterium]
MILNIEESDGTGVLSLSDNLTIERAKALKSVLTASLDKADVLILDLSEVTDLDLACLQLFCSANRTFESLDKQLTLKNNGADIYKKALNDAGYSLDQCLAENCCEKCLWEEIE